MKTIIWRDGEKEVYIKEMNAIIWREARKRGVHKGDEPHNLKRGKRKRCS
jgi:hypothetical protein